MASNNFFSSLTKKIKEQQEDTEKKIKESLGGSNTSSSKSSSTESKGLKKNGTTGLSQTVTTSGGNNNITRNLGSNTSGNSTTNKQKSSTITNADKLLSGVKSGISSAVKATTTTATKPTTTKKQATNQASSTLKKNTMAGVNAGITSGLKKTTASKVDQLLNPTNKKKTTATKVTGTGVLEDVDDNDQILSIMDANKKKAAEEKKNTSQNNLLALFNLGYANERMQNAFGNLGSWLGGTTKEVENATEYGMARKDIQARETAKELELNNALKADIKDLSEGQRQIRRDYLNQNNNEIDLKIQETKEKLEELNRTTEKVSSLNNYLYTDEYESRLESALGDEYGRYLLENEIDERDLPLSQYQGIWAENRTNEYENLQNTIQGYEMQKKNNQADLDELDYYDKLGTKYGAMVNQEKRKEYISKLEEENAQLQAEVDLADQYVKDFTEGKESIYKDEKEVWEANQENINKKLKISENQKEIDDLRRTFGILDDDIEDDANYHEEYYGGFNRYYNPNKDRNGTGPQYDTNDIHRIVSFINDGEEYEMWSTRNGVGLKAYITGDYSGAGAMLDSEREQLTKLYNAAMAEGREPVEAQAFFTALQPTLNARLRVYEELSNRVTARTLPILSTLGSVAASATQLPLAIMTAYGAATGADWAEDPNGWLGANTRMQRDIESQVAEDLGPVGGFVYKGAVSGAKNFLRGIMYGPLGGNAAEIGTLAQFFGEAFYQNYFDELENTHDVAGSALKSLLNAGVSTITEIVSVEKMYSDPTNWWQYFLQNISAEMGEEGEEAIISPVLNRLFFGTDEIEERSLDNFRQMQEQGFFTDKDGNKIKLTDDTIGQASYMAWEQATKGYINENVEGMFIAGLSAGGSAAVGAFNILAENRKANKNVGGAILQSGVEETDDKKTRMAKEGTNTFKLLELGEGFKAGTETKRIADSIRADIRAGKGVKKTDIGQLARSIVGESSEKVAQVSQDILGDVFKAELKESGVENPIPISNALVKVIAQGDFSIETLSVISGSEPALKIIREYQMGKFNPQVENIKEQTAADRAASKSVMEMLPQANDADVTADAVKQIVAGATVAAKEDIRNAEGARTGNKGETVSEGKIADIAGIALKSVDVEVEGDDGKPKTEQQTRWQVTMSDGREVDIADVAAVDQDVAEALTFLQNDSGKVIGQNLADAVIKIATTKKAGKAGGDMATTLSGAVRVMWAAATEQATPKISGMSAADAAAITDAVKADLEDSEKKRTAAFTVLAAGKGTTTLNGVAYGTNAFKEMVNKVVRDNNLGDNVKTEAQVIGSIAKSVGAQVELYYDAEDTANQGMFTAGGGIRINLAGTTNREGAHRSALATFAHEVTHNIEANSQNAYRALRSFVFTSLGGKLNIQSELSRIQAAYAHYGENLDIAGAVSELVAKACETVLTDENVIRQLQEQDADLAGTVGDAVNELVERVQAIRGDALTSASMYARAMGDVSRGLSQAWMKAYREAASTTGTTQAAGNNEYSFAGTDPDTGRSVYISDYKAGTPSSVKAQALIDTVQNLWSKKPITLQITENGKKRKIQANFDPDYDATGARKTDLGKMTHPEFGPASRRRVALNLSGDYYQILEESEYDQSKPEEKNHPGVNQWHYFVDDIYYAEQGEDEATPYRIAINIKEKNDGSFVYAYYPQRLENEQTKKLSVMGIKPVNTRVMSGESASASTEGSRFPNPIDTGTKGNRNSSDVNIIENEADPVKMDERYRAAVEAGDIRAATEMLVDKLRKTNGVIPIIAPEWHTGESRRIAESLKLNNPEAIEAAAQIMQKYVPENAVLIPMPGSSGKVAAGSWTMNLTNRIAELTGRPVVVALEGVEHESRQKAKSRGERGVSQEELGFRKIAEIPDGTIPVFIDNTVGTGVTADAAQDAMGGGITLAFSKTLLSPGIKGLKNVVVTYESKRNGGGLIPLSQRFNVEKRDVRYSISDEAYMDAVRAKSTDEAQLIVDETAKANGFTEKVYHGTPTGGFTVFKDWSYFTKNRDYAARYQHASASSIRGSYDTTNPMIYELYMNPGKVFDTRKPAHAKIYNQMRMEYGLDALGNTSTGLPDWTAGRDIAEFIEENGLDFDTFLLDEGADGGYGEEVVSRGISYVTRSNRVKSAEAITRDNNDEIIPPSERFKVKEPDIRFSMQEPVEINKDGLIAVHNLTRQNLYDTLQEGGFTAPSIAVIWASMGHTKYGEISVVFKPQSIDPRKSVRNKVYGTDAWTPTRGNAQIETKLNYQVIQNVRDQIEQLMSGEDVNEFTNDALNWINHWLYEDQTTDTMDEIIRKAYNNDGMMIAYEKANGREIEKKTTFEKNHSELKHESIGLYNGFLNHLEELGMLQEFMNDMANETGFTILEKYTDIFGESSEEAKKYTDAYNKNPDSKLNRNLVYNKMKQARWFQEDGREIKTYNKYSPQETAESIRDNLNKSDFDNWIRGMMESALGKKGVYNGKDLFTSSGSRRSFEATHDEPTAENIVRAMYRNHSAKGGEAGGATGLMAKASKEYRSLKEVRADASRLQTIDEEEYKNLVHELDLKLNDFAKRISENSELDYYSIKQELIDAGEVYAKHGTAESIRRYLAKQGIKLDTDQIIEAKAIMDEAQNMPTGYFEAKPETVVGFDEIDKVIMPADSELERMLADRNIPYVVTDGTEEDRMEKLNERQEAKFSIQDEMDYDVQSWMETVPEWSLKTEAEKTLLQDFKSLRMKMQLDRERESQTLADIKKLEELLAGPTDGSVTRPETMENALEAAGVEIRPADPKKVLSNPTLIKNGKVIGFIYGNDRVRVSNKADPAIFEEMGFAVDRKTKMATYVNPEGNQMGNTATKRKLEALKVKLQNIRNTQEKTREKLAQITGNEGFGGMMYRQQQVLNDLLYNKTQGEVQDSVERMQKRADAVARTIEQNQKTIAEMEKGGIVQKLKEILGTTTAEQAVRELKQMTNSTWTRNEITPLFNEIVLKMTQGQDYQQEIENLAGILVNSSKDNAALDEDLSALRGMTLVISEGQLKELRGQGSSLKEIRQRLAGTGITVKTGEFSSLTDNLDDTIAEYGPALFQDLGDEKDALENFVTRVEQRRNDAIISNQYAERLADTMAQIAAKAAGVAQGIYMPSDRTAQKQVLAMMEYVKGLAAQTQQAQKTLQGIADDMAAIQKEGRQASGMAGALARDVNVALDYYSRINQVAQQSARNQRQQAIIEQLKSKQAEKILKNNEEWRQLIARDAQARKQTEENAKTRGKINTVVKRMYNLLKNPKGTTNIPESMQGIARTVLESIVGNDLGGLKLTRVAAKDLAEISRVLRAWTERDGAPTMPTAGETSDDASLEIIEQDVQKIRDGISQYNADIRGANKVETLQQRGEILKGIQEALSEIYTRIRTENEVFVRGRQVQVANAAADVLDGTEGKNFKERTGFIGQKLAALHKMIVSGNMTPEYFFRYLANDGLTALWDNYHDAENRNGLELAKSKARMEEIAERYGYSNWDMKARQTVKLASGDVQMTMGQIMSLWATWNREQQLGPEMSSHLTSGGFYVEEQDLREGILGKTEVKKRAHRVTEEDMAAIEGMLTQEQKDFVNAVVRYMSNDMSELGNEASMAAYGIKMYKENYYFPMQMWDGIKSRKSNDAAQGASIDRAFHPSFSKSRMHGANNALVIGDFMQVATDHIAGMINYATMGLANESLQKVLNYTLTEGENAEEATKRNVRARLEEAYGQEAMQYLLKLQMQLNGGAVKVEKTIADKLISGFRKNAVAGSLSVALQQPLSYIRASMLINPKYLTKATLSEYWKDSYTERMKYSGVSVIKEMGRFDMNAGQSAREFLTPEGKESTGRKAWNKFEEYVTILPELMDRWTWNRMWVAVKAEQHAQHPEMDIKSEEFMTMCGERFNDVMRRTQVYDSTLVKSENMRNDHFWMRSLTSFMAEPTLTLNVLADAVRSAKEGETGGKALLGKAVATFALSAVLQAAFKGLMGSGRNPDDKKTWEENFLYRFFSSLISEADPLQLIPGFSDLITLMKDGKLEDDALSIVGKMFTSLAKAKDLVTGKEESKGWYRDLEDTAGQLIQLFSKVPLKNIMRDSRAMYNFVTQPYAKRDTSGNVIANQAADLFFNADNFIGVINDWMGDSGYKTDNAAYKKRVYEAMRDGNDTAAQNYIDYLLNGKGLKSEKSIMTGQNGVTSYVMDDYQAGKITRTKADELLKIANPNMKDQDRAKKLDEVDYEAKTGEEADNFSLYTPLYDAMDQGNTSEIEAQKKHLAEVGVKESTISKNMKTHIRNQYEEGTITRTQAEEQYRKYAPGISEKDLAETLDEIDYEKEIGKDVEGYSLYTRIYSAVDSGDTATIKSQKAYLKTLGIEEKSVNSQIASYISSQYKEGKMKKSDAESKLKNYAGKDENDIFWTLDRIDYTKQTGKKVDSTEKYYRLYDAMDANKSADIQSAVKAITSHGTYESNVKTTINGHYKQLYLNGSESQRVAIQDAMQKAYEALGYKKKSANTTINNWKKGK